MEAAGKPYLQDLAAAALGLDHLIALIQSHGHGLFEQHVLAGVQRVDGERRVQVVRHGDRDRLDRRVVQQLAMVVVNLGQTPLAPSGLTLTLDRIGARHAAGHTLLLHYLQTPQVCGGNIA